MSFFYSAVDVRYVRVIMKMSILDNHISQPIDCFIIVLFLAIQTWYNRSFSISWYSVSVFFSVRENQLLNMIAICDLSIANASERWMCIYVCIGMPKIKHIHSVDEIKSQIVKRVITYSQLALSQLIFDELRYKAEFIRITRPIKSKLVERLIKMERTVG